MIKSFLILGFAMAFVAGLHVQAEHEAALSGVITIQDKDGIYLTRCNNCGDGKFEDSASLHETNPAYGWANWKVEVPSPGKVALKCDSGKYLALCQNCWYNSTDPFAVFVSSDTPTGGAVWTPLNLGNNIWAFKATNGKWLAKCNQCVGNNPAYENFAFVNAINPSRDRNAQWTVKPGKI